MKPRHFIMVFLLQFSLIVSLCAQWVSAGRLNIPKNYYTFLAAMPSGDLIVVTFNLESLDKPPLKMPALLIKNPTSSSPQVVRLCDIDFPPQRGYSGLACDEKGNFYVSGDTGSPESCFVRKFKADGSPDLVFGNNGEIMPKMRCLGLDVLGKYLLLAVNWGNVQIYETETGKLIGNFPKDEKEIYVRDIAIDPASMTVYGVAVGSIVAWEGGSLEEPSKYKFRVLTPEEGKIRSEEGISFDPILRAALVVQEMGNQLVEYKKDGSISKTAVSTASPNAHLSDSVLSFDGSTLFVSDITGKNIHILKRKLSESAGDVAPVIKPQPATAPAEMDVKPVEWNKSYTDVMDQARRERKPLIVYFRSKDVKKCEEIESQILLTKAFYQQAKDFICVFEDISFNRLLAYRFGVIRVPHIVVLDRNAQITGRFTFNITQDGLFSAILAAK